MALKKVNLQIVNFDSDALLLYYDLGNMVDTTFCRMDANILLSKTCFFFNLKVPHVSKSSIIVVLYPVVSYLDPHFCFFLAT